MRAVVPGVVGARNVKWLARVEVGPGGHGDGRGYDDG